MKLIHTSDWHLGAKLREQDRLDEQQQFLNWLLEQLRSEKPDALLVSGDIFDTYTPSNAATERYYSFIGTVFSENLCRHIVVTAGNHDSPSLLESPQQALVHLHTHVIGQASGQIADEVVCIPDDKGKTGLVIGAVPFLRDADLFNAASSEDIADRPARLRNGFINHYASVVEAARETGGSAPLVLMGHCVIANSRISDDGSERARPIASIGGLEGYPRDILPPCDYLALGHLHIPQIIGGNESVRYAGSPIAMSFSEAHDRKSIAIAEFGPTTGTPPVIRTTEIPVFQKLESITGTPEAVETRIAELVAGLESIWVSIQIDAGEGELSDLWRSLDTATENTSIKILMKHDARPSRYGIGITEDGTVDLATLTPLDIARKRLLEEHLTEAETTEYLQLIDSIVQSADLPGSEAHS